MSTGVIAAAHKGPLTAERLREVLDYDPETGRFTRRPRTTKRRLHPFGTL